MPKPTTLFVGRTRFALPLDASVERKLAALRDELDLHILACGSPNGTKLDPALHLIEPFPVRRLDRLVFWAALPFRIAREVRRLRPQSIVAESPLVGFGALVGRRLARSCAFLVVEVHGDWRATARLYGSRARRLLGPLTDRVAVFTLRRADRVRALSDFTAGLCRAIGVEPSAVFPAYTDLASFAASPPRPLPRRPRALFVGVLERYKNIEGLADAWRLAAPRLKGVTLHVVGRGHDTAVIEELRAEFPGQVEWTPELPPAGVAEAMDGASLLVLPSRSEGLPRVAIEALSRGRPVVGSPSGGIPDIVRDGINGRIVEPEDAHDLAETLVSLLGRRERLEPLALRARASATPWLQTPEQFARAFAELVAGDGSARHAA